MLRRLRRFFTMSDAERARILATISAVVIIVVLYALGALSLHLRSRYLGPNSVASSPTPVVSPTSARVSETATPTLYPTLTPKPAKPVAAVGLPLGRRVRGGAVSAMGEYGW